MLPIYETPSQNEGYFINQIEKISDSLSNSMQNSLIFGDFNMEVTNNILNSFIENKGLYGLLKSPTCFKLPTNLKCIDHMRTNKKHSFSARQSETWPSDFHPLIYTELNTQFTNLDPKRVRFCDYKQCSESRFLSALTGEVLGRNTQDLVHFKAILWILLINIPHIKLSSLGVTANRM